MLTLKLFDSAWLQQVAADPGAALAAYPNRDAVQTIMADMAEAILALYATTGAAAPWLNYLAIRDADTAILGLCGFKSEPVGGLVEIAYFTIPGHEGTGVATTMARNLLRIAFAAPEVAALLAHTLPEQNASTVILRRCGFTHIDVVDDPDDGTVWRWALARADYRPS